MKHFYMLFVFLIVLILSACNNSDPGLSDDTIPSDRLINLVQSYQEKLTSIIENDEKSNELLSFKQMNLAFDEEDPYYMTRESFLDVYNAQRSNAQDVQLSPHLMIYKDLLDNVYEEIKARNISSIEAQIDVAFRDYLDIEAYVSIISDQYILVKLTMSVHGNEQYYGIKFGYEEEDFFLRELSMNTELGGFSYFEFLENHQMIDITYVNGSYWYRYQNQNDNTYYEISKDVSQFNNDYVLSWFNPETNIRTRIIRTGEGHMNLIEWFNYRGIYFSFVEYIESEQIDVAWQLLEATGWDGAYLEPNKSNPLNGIYKDGEKIFSDARVNIGLDINFANVRMEYSYVKSELTNDILNLSAYGLDFNYDDVNLEFINDTISNVFEESSHLSVYRGIDFVNDDLSQSLYAVIDEDIKP
jgi:hypothetical protein